MKREPGAIRKEKKFIGILMNRRDAVNSALTNFVTVPQKTASLLVEAWDARHPVCLIVSERAAENLFVRSFLFHKSYVVTVEAIGHVRITRNCVRRGPHGQTTAKLGSSSLSGVYRLYISRSESCLLQSGAWDNHRPNVQGFASLESGLSKNRLAPSDGPSFRVKWECFGLYCKSLFTDLADRDKDVSISHFHDGSELPPVRSLPHTWNATHHAATAAVHADVHVLSLKTVLRCNLLRGAKWLVSQVVLSYTRHKSL